MPTCDFYILCPYFVSMKGNSIKCEDTIRYFDTVEERNKQIKNCCEPGLCIYATRLDALYERMENMTEDKATIEKLMYTAKCKDAEITKLKKQLTYEKNKTEIEKQKAEHAEHMASQQDNATKYIIKAKNEEVQKLEKRIAENQIISEQKLRAMEMMVGYLCKKFKVKSFRLSDVQKFGLKYETLCSIPDMEDDEIKLDIKVKKDDKN